MTTYSNRRIPTSCQLSKEHYGGIIIAVSCLVLLLSLFGANAQARICLSNIKITNSSPILINCGTAGTVNATVDYIIDNGTLNWGNCWTVNPPRNFTAQLYDDDDIIWGFGGRELYAQTTITVPAGQAQGNIPFSFQVTCTYDPDCDDCEVNGDENEAELFVAFWKELVGPGSTIKKARCVCGNCAHRLSIDDFSGRQEEFVNTEILIDNTFGEVLSFDVFMHFEKEVFESPEIAFNNSTIQENVVFTQPEYGVLHFSAEFEEPINLSVGSFATIYSGIMSNAPVGKTSIYFDDTSVFTDSNGEAIPCCLVEGDAVILPKEQDPRFNLELVDFSPCYIWGSPGSIADKYLKELPGYLAVKGYYGDNYLGMARVHTNGSFLFPNVTLPPGSVVLLVVSDYNETGKSASIQVTASDMCDCNKDGVPDGDDIFQSISDADKDGFLICGGDCDDDAATVYPGAEEVCDGKDNDCDGNVPANEFDLDADGYRICENDCEDSDQNINPGAIEVCNNKDDNCNSVVDDGCEGATIKMTFKKGWSMFSLPVITERAKVSDVFTNVIVFYRYEKGVGYIDVKDTEELKPRIGYWILLDKEQSYTFIGQAIEEYSLTIENGWYMIGGCTYPARVSVDNGHIVVIYGYVQGVGYQRVTPPEVIEPGYGYWILIEDISDQAEVRAEIISYFQDIRLRPEDGETVWGYQVLRLIFDPQKPPIVKSVNYNIGAGPVDLITQQNPLNEKIGTAEIILCAECLNAEEVDLTVTFETSGLNPITHRYLIDHLPVLNILAKPVSEDKIVLDANASYDPEGKPLSIIWQHAGTTIKGPEYHTSPEAISEEGVFVQLTDGVTVTDDLVYRDPNGMIIRAQEKGACKDMEIVTNGPSILIPRLTLGPTLEEGESLPIDANGRLKRDFLLRYYFEVRSTLEESSVFVIDEGQDIARSHSFNDTDPNAIIHKWGYMRNESDRSVLLDPPYFAPFGNPNQPGSLPVSDNYDHHPRKGPILINVPTGVREIKNAITKAKRKVGNAEMMIWLDAPGLSISRKKPHFNGDSGGMFYRAHFRTWMIPKIPPCEKHFYIEIEVDKFGKIIKNRLRFR